MQNQTLDSPLGKLVFRCSDGLLHSLDPNGELLLEAFHKGFSVDELTEYFQDTGSAVTCNQQLTLARQEWLELGLLDQKERYSPYRLLLSPGLETIEVTTNSQVLFTYLQGCYQSVSVDKEQVMSAISIQQNEVDDTFEILVNGQKKHRATHLEEAILAVCYEIGEEATHEEPRLLVAHAAALTRNENVWLFPAQTGSGKSTLTANLIKHGYKLINDDVVPINHDGTVTALNLPLKIKSGAWETLTPLYPALQGNEIILRADNLQMKNLALSKYSLCQAGSTHRINGMIVPKFDRWQLEPSSEQLSPNQKLQAFLQAEPYFPHRLTRPYLQKVIDWLEPIPAWSIKYSNSEQALDLIHKISHQNQTPPV